MPRAWCSGAAGPADALPWKMTRSSFTLQVFQDSPATCLHFQLRKRDVCQLRGPSALLTTLRIVAQPLGKSRTGDNASETSRWVEAGRARIGAASLRMHIVQR